MAGPLVLKQAHSVIDTKTTELCLDVAGQIRPVDEPFETLNGPLMAPPFHIHCRAHVTPWVRGFVSDERRRANAELRTRLAKHKKKGPAGFEGRRQPPLPRATVEAPKQPPPDPVALLRSAFEAGHTVVRELTGGNVAQSVRLVRLSDGRLAVLKKGTREEARREYLGGRVANAVGVDDVHTAQVSETEVLTTFIDGEVGSERLRQVSEAAQVGVRGLSAARNAAVQAVLAEMQRLRSGPGGREIALVDWLVDNQDRHDLNWIVRADGSVRGIDLGNAKFSALRIENGLIRGLVPDSPFTQEWLGLKTSFGGFDSMSPKLTKAEVAEIRAALELIAHEFTLKERAWYRAIVQRLNLLEAGIS